MDPMNEGDDPDRERRLACRRSSAPSWRSPRHCGGSSATASTPIPAASASEAGAINRAFREVTGVILQEVGSVEYDAAPAVFMMVLRHAALGRLHELGVIGAAAEGLIDWSRDSETPGWPTWRSHRSR